MRIPTNPASARSVGVMAAAILAGNGPGAMAQAHSDRPTAHPTRITETIRIDGVLDEPAWRAADPVTGFTQFEPDEGRPASASTDVRILLDGDALYVGARMLDPDIRGIDRRLGRRDDDSPSDYFAVLLDPFHDHLHAARFQVAPGGTVTDASIAPGSPGDAAWDPVWQVKVTVDAGGWTAEMRIPLAQLRFARDDAGIWGIQFERFLLRRLERSVFAFTPKRLLPSAISLAGTAPTHFGHLTGMVSLPATAGIELLPYAAATATYVHDPIAGPTLRDPGGQYDRRFGADLRWTLSSAVTLNAAFHPDFGQVEVDPAVVNLTAFETILPEKRPFFVEGTDRFQFGRLRAYYRMYPPIAFYSRRIGRAPQLSPFRNDTTAYALAPDRTAIQGAVKLLGQTSGGWTFGVLDALTRTERASILSRSNQLDRVVVEPRTNHLVVRAQRDLRNGETTIGVLATALHREVGDSFVGAWLPASAYLGGIEVAHAWGARRWALDGNLSWSRVAGSATALTRIQESSARYFQRPDAEHDRLDSRRTELTGHNAELALTKLSGRHWVGSVALQDNSPGYETNDLGLLFAAGRRAVSLDVHYQEFQPSRYFRNYIIWPFSTHQWNYDGQLVRNELNFWVQAELNNRWQAAVWYRLLAPAIDDRLTRGGPVTRTVANHYWYYQLTSPRRHWVGFQSSSSFAWTGAGDRELTGAAGISLRPRPSVQVRFDPTVRIARIAAQYVGQYADPTATETFANRYLFAHLRQRQLGLETRVDWTLTPRLSFQLYSQHLIVSGGFDRYAALARPATFQFARFGTDLGTITRDPSGITVDADGVGPGPAFQLARPDFTLRSFQVNAVARWEFHPGSTMFFVWQHRDGATTDAGTLVLRRDLAGLTAGPADNVVAIKVSYWISR